MARKKYEDDDGRVIANMNVDGMPWYLRSGRPGQNAGTDSDLSDLTENETKEIIKGAVKAGLLIGGIFLAACFLFILFCLFVWFK